MLPPWIAGLFGEAPRRVVDRCRPHTWAGLTTAPGPGTRSTRDILVHMVDTEALYIDHIVQGVTYRELDPEAFASLDAVLRHWDPQRAASMRFIQALSPEERAGRRPLPWDPATTSTVEELVWHVVTHEFYHYGQITTRLALLQGSGSP